MSLTLELICLVLGDGPSHIFGVEIKDNKKVSDLKEFMKDNTNPALTTFPPTLSKSTRFSFP
jgi:hypothetical protein